MIDGISAIIAASAEIPGWTKGDDAREVALASHALGDHPTLVEVGVFMGRCSVLLAGPRRLRGSGKLHCVDPFDCSGDAFSIPHYEKALQATGHDNLETVFRMNMERCGIDTWIDVHRGPANQIARNWTAPIDLLLLDGDQSPEGARAAYEAWVPFLKEGGVIILRNTKDRAFAEGHDGHRRLALTSLVPPLFTQRRQVGATTFAVKAQNQMIARPK